MTKALRLTAEIVADTLAHMADSKGITVAALLDAMKTDLTAQRRFNDLMAVATRHVKAAA